MAIDGPEGSRGQGGADTALAAASASAAQLTSQAWPDGSPGIDELLSEARSGLARLRPEAALAANHAVARIRGEKAQPKYSTE